MDVDEKKIRISKITAILMIGTALLYDIFQIALAPIPVLGWIVSYCILFITFMTFNVLWFHIVGIYFFEQLIGKGGRALIFFLITIFFETITLGILPGITIWIALTIHMSRLDDELVARGIISEEELKRIDKIVKKGEKKGYSSTEFREELLNELTEQVKTKVKNKSDNIKRNLVDSKLDKITSKINSVGKEIDKRYVDGSKRQMT